MPQKPIKIKFYNYSLKWIELKSCFKYKDVKILLLGLDNAGKTTILKTISGENSKNVGPTKGFNVKLVEKDCFKFTFWDLGGQESIRHVWENYFEENDAIVH